ncbi:MAG: hypothetical protein EA401_12255 [Planctomycetota bacterium]|nr:MAG: hypothetical protein EA401_12255 [Planctomycetota bacterium]
MRLFTRTAVWCIAAILMSGVAGQPVSASEQVLEVRDVDRILVQYRRLPVYLSLANVDIPSGGDLREQALQRIGELISDQGVQVIYEDSFGHDDAGIPRVYLRRGNIFVNVILVSEGLARYVPSDGDPSSYERLLANAHQRAQRDEIGIWAKGDEDPDPTSEEAAPAAPAPEGREGFVAGQADADPSADAGFVAELNGRHYYPAGHPAVANVHRNRLIRYSDEASARRAGKTPAPQVDLADLPEDDGTRAAADAVFERAVELYAQAQNMPATRARDEAYTQALTVLTEAVQRYSNLLEQSPDDADLGEYLRRAMQYRYGAMKMRRSH